MKYKHTCRYGTTLVGIRGHENNSCGKCRLIKGGQPKKTVKISLNGIEFEISTKHKLYNLRYKIIARCYNAKPSEFNAYQGKGIKVCDEWRNDASSFFHWALSNGWREGLTIDRINSSKDYCPENCQIITLSENCKKAHVDNPVFGERHGKSKLKTSEAIEIKKQLKEGFRVIDICKNLSVSQDCVADIKRGRTWKHI